MDQGECVSRGEKALGKNPQSTSTLRGWTQKEESTGRLRRFQKGGVKQIGPSILGAKERECCRKEERGPQSEVSEKSLEVRTGAWPTDSAIRRQ